MANILVLKLGALGNMILSLSAFAAIRQHHPGARITLLTTAPYAAWMAGAPWFDRVLTDTRPAWWDLPGVLRLRRTLADGHFDCVYDLQTSSRSSHYFRLFPRAARPEWSGIAPGCSHPDRDPDRDRIHDIDRQHGQLRQAGIAAIPPPDLSWCHGDISPYALPRPFALLVPGSSAHRPVKRWPAEHFRIVAEWLTQRGITPVVLGTAGECNLAETIGAGRLTHGAGIPRRRQDEPRTGAKRAPPPLEGGGWGEGSMCANPRPTPPPNPLPQGEGEYPSPHPADPDAYAGTPVQCTGARDLTGQTSFGDLAELARTARLAIGNDTGPMHMLAAAGCPSLVLFSRDSDPARCAPRAPPGKGGVRVLRRDDLATLTPAEVIAEITDAQHVALPVPAEAPA